MPTKAAPPILKASGVAETSSDSVAGQARTRQLFADFWPPVGWPMFACITRPSGTVMSSERNARGEQTILKYQVSIAEDGLYTIEILHGTMTRNGEFSLSPAIGIQFSGREDWSEIDNGERSDNAVLDVYVGGQRLIPERGLILRVILAVTFLISRIDRGIPPNLKKTLKLYRLS